LVGCFDRLLRGRWVDVLRCFSRLFFTLLPTCNGTGQFFEKLLDVAACFGGNLHIGEPQFVNFGIGQPKLNNSFGIEVTLVTHNHNESLLASDFPHVVDPLAQIGEGVGIFMKKGVLVISKTISAALESFI
jgi:hypothetical protein